MQGSCTILFCIYCLLHW